MFLLIYVHRKLTSEKENSFFDFIQKGRWAITKSVVGWIKIKPTLYIADENCVHSHRLNEIIKSK